MSLHLTSEAASAAWDDLAQRLEQFIDTWEEGIEPKLYEFLPPGPPAHRRVVLVELVKVDLEYRTPRGREKPLEKYASEFPELLEDGEPPCDLIYEEFHIRKSSGQPVDLTNYCQRFPRSAEALRRLMGTDAGTASTQLFTPSRKVEGVAVGQRLDDFDLLIELGKGAFGSVFLARQLSMQRLVALKVSADKGNEGQTLAHLEHPNIVRIFDQRRLPEQRVRLLYMQFAPGGTLAEVVRLVQKTPPGERNGGLLATAVNEAIAKSGGIGGGSSPAERRLAAASWPETVCRVGVQLAQALDHAHRQGILHRDVKPANVLLAGDGSPKLADFNISFCSQLEGATPAAYFGGSVAYMSPEQLEACNPTHRRQAEELDGRSDLYALAVVLWELLHGSRPFSDTEMTGGWTATLNEMTRRRLEHKPVPPTPLADPIAVRLEQVLRKALQPDPADRHADGAAMARELSLCLHPRAWDLVHGAKTGWRGFARQHPLIALVLLNLPPFALAGWFNYWYNKNVFVLGLTDRQQEAFEILKFWVNGILYPLGMGLILAPVLRIKATLRRLDRGGLVTEEESRLARRKALALGHRVAPVGLTLWVVAGLAFPIGIHAMAGHLEANGYLFFLLSMTASGLISCCLPFLATTWLSVRVLFPALLANSTPHPVELRQLTALGRQAGFYLFASPVAPMGAVLLIIFSASNNQAFSDSNKQAAITVLVFATIIGFAAAYYAYQGIRSDLAALSIATRPVNLFGSSTDSVDGF